MSLSKSEVAKRVARALSQATRLPRSPRPSDRLVDDLGFDSLKIAALALALEKELGRPLLLTEWISRCSDPSELTMSSLCDYVGSVLDRDG